MTKIVLLPQTYLASDISSILSCCFDEVFVLRPPDISLEEMHDTGRLPDMARVLEASGNDKDIGLEPGTLQNLMRRWENFIASQGSSGALEIIKAGVRPQKPDRETTTAIKYQIIGGAQPEKQPKEPPSASPALVLKLAHLMDQKAADLRSMAKRIDSQQEHLSELLGPHPEEEAPAEFQKTAAGLASTMGFEPGEESLTSYRLQAWASLAPLDEIKDLTPLTLSPQAAVLLLERANIFLGGKPVRSSAGTQSLLWPPVSLSMAGIKLAREALRLRLPLPEEAPQFKKALGMMLEAIGETPMSAELLKHLEEIGGSWLESGGSQKPGGQMGLMVFPGYSMAGLVNLMKGQASEPEGQMTSCPLWVLW